MWLDTPVGFSQVSLIIQSSSQVGTSVMFSGFCSMKHPSHALTKRCGSFWQDKQTDGTHEIRVQPKSVIWPCGHEGVNLAKEPCSSHNMRCWHVAPRVHSVTGQCEEAAGSKCHGNHTNESDLTVQKKSCTERGLGDFFCWFLRVCFLLNSLSLSSARCQSFCGCSFCLQVRRVADENLHGSEQVLPHTAARGSPGNARGTTSCPPQVRNRGCLASLFSFKAATRLSA